MPTEPGRTAEPSPNRDDAALQAQQAHQLFSAQSPDGTLLAVLHLGAERSALAVGSGRAPPAVHAFDLGLQSVAARYFRHTPPTPLELEEAIAAVEDEVMPLHRLMPAGAELVTADRSIAPMLDASPAASARHGIDAVERAFERLAAVSLGRPLSQEPALADPSVAAAVLILREVMHHLGFERVTMGAGPTGA